MSGKIEKRKKKLSKKVYGSSREVPTTEGESFLNHLSDYCPQVIQILAHPSGGEIKKVKDDLENTSDTFTLAAFPALIFPIP